MEDQFKIEEYMKKILSEEQDLTVKKHMEDMLRGVFEPLKKQLWEKYDALEEKVLSEELKNQDGLEVYTALANRKDLDLQVTALFPMDEADLESREVTTKELFSFLQRDGACEINSFFVTGNYSIVREFLEGYRKFAGKVVTEEETYHAVFEVRQDTHYQNYIKELYDTFIDNGLEWRTVFAPHLFRAFRLYLINTDCPEEEEIQSIEADLEEYTDDVAYDMVPVWNIRKREESTSAYPNPSMTQMQFEHVIYKHRLQESCRYIPVGRETALIHVQNLNGDLMITCQEEKPVRWELFEIHPFQEQPSDIEVFHNGMQKRGLAKQSYQNGVRTKAELIHYVGMLGQEQNLTLQDIFLTDSMENTETYSMDSFLEDEIRSGQKAQTLVLCFCPTVLDAVYNNDRMSYLVSRVQWFFPEYHCVGTFRKSQKKEALD